MGQVTLTCWPGFIIGQHPQVGKRTAHAKVPRRSCPDVTQLPTLPRLFLTVVAGKADASQEKVWRQEKVGISRDEPGLKNPRKLMLGEEL